MRKTRGRVVTCKTADLKLVKELTKLFNCLKGVKPFQNHGKIYQKISTICYSILNNNNAYKLKQKNHLRLVDHSICTMYYSIFNNIKAISRNLDLPYGGDRAHIWFCFL